MARRKPDRTHVHARIGTVRGQEGEGAKVVTEDVIDRYPVHDVTTGKRRVLTLPPDLCRRLGISEGTPLRIVEYRGSFEVTPMRLVPATPDHAETLEDLVDRITSENIHGEVDTGPAVGQESW